MDMVVSDRNAVITELLANGESLAVIAERVGLSKSRVGLLAQRLRRNGTLAVRKYACICGSYETRHPRPAATHFWPFVNKGDGCWLWTVTKGYGRANIDGCPSRTASRVSWELVNGPIPDGLWVLHRCDNPPCVRPDHLFLGTAQQNTADMMAKGRHAGQVRHGSLHYYARRVIA